MLSHARVLSDLWPGHKWLAAQALCIGPIGCYAYCDPGLGSKCMRQCDEKSFKIDSGQLGIESMK